MAFWDSIINSEKPHKPRHGSVQDFSVSHGSLLVCLIVNVFLLKIESISSNCMGVQCCLRGFIVGFTTYITTDCYFVSLYKFNSDYKISHSDCVVYVCACCFWDECPKCRSDARFQWWRYSRCCLVFTYSFWGCYVMNSRACRLVAGCWYHSRVWFQRYRVWKSPRAMWTPLYFLSWMLVKCNKQYVPGTS